MNINYYILELALPDDEKGAQQQSDVFFAMAKIRRMGHDHQAPFWHLVVLLLLLEVSSGDAKRKQAATCTIHLGPPIFLQILDPLYNDH